jgi:hypothetical protein
MKKCSGCGLEKTLECFSKKVSYKNILQSKCKTCSLIYQAEYRSKNAEKLLQQRREKYEQIKSDPIRRARYLESIKINTIRSHQRYPGKQQARMAVDYAVRTNNLIRPDFCNECGVPCKPEAHHESYEKDQWLNVIWMCRSCHAANHRKHKALIQ